MEEGRDAALDVRLMINDPRPSKEWIEQANPDRTRRKAHRLMNDTLYEYYSHCT